MTQVRISLSTNDPPICRRGQVVHHEGEVIQFVPLDDLDDDYQRDGTFFGRALPDEFFVRELLEIDADDVEQIKSAMDQFGTFAPWAFEDDQILPEGLISREVTQARAVARKGVRLHKGWTVSATETRTHIRVAQCMVEHWIAHTEGQPIADVWRRWFGDEVEAVAQRVCGPERLRAAGAPTFADLTLQRDDPAWLHVMQELRDAPYWLLFQYCLNCALAPLSPHVWARWDEPRTEGTETTAYTAAMWQLYEHMLDTRSVLRRCANPKCQRRFFRSRGRAKKGQYKETGLLYCSHSCATSVANRAMRKRKKEAAAKPAEDH